MKRLESLILVVGILVFVGHVCALDGSSHAAPSNEPVATAHPEASDEPRRDEATPHLASCDVTTSGPVSYGCGLSLGAVLPDDVPVLAIAPRPAEVSGGPRAGIRVTPPLFLLHAALLI